MSTCLQILIPTFNRADFLRKNLAQLSGEILNYGLCKRVAVLVQDNCSTDLTSFVLNEFGKECKISFKYSVNEENVGLERNAVTLLGTASADYVMYLGDDDYLSPGYVKYCIDMIESDRALGAIVPSNIEVWDDGRKRVSRSQANQVYESGFSSVLKASHLGHQLSGLVLKREGLYEEYIKSKENRNIYPFIFWLGRCLLGARCYYVGTHPVEIWQSNKKDWAYDASGLLNEIFKNYRLLFQSDSFRQSTAELAFVSHQRWRLRPTNPWYCLMACLSIACGSVATKRTRLFIIPYGMLSCLKVVFNKYKESLK